MKRTAAPLIMMIVDVSNILPLDCLRAPAEAMKRSTERDATQFRNGVSTRGEAGTRICVDPEDPRAPGANRSAQQTGAMTQRARSSGLIVTLITRAVGHATAYVLDSLLRGYDVPEIRTVQEYHQTLRVQDHHPRRSPPNLRSAFVICSRLAQRGSQINGK